MKRLRQAHLLEGEQVWAGLSRRRVLTRIGIGAAAAALLPVITTVLAPTSAEASTMLGGGSPCVSGHQCRSGQCIGGFCR